MTRSINLPVGLRAKMHPLEAAGLWPFAPLSGPMSKDSLPRVEDPQDYQFDVEMQKVVHRPGWWRRLAFTEATKGEGKSQ